MKWQYGLSLILGLALAGMVYAAEGEGTPEQGADRFKGPGKGKGPGHGMRRRGPPPPLIVALDADKDRVISAEEIENASEALKSLDKNGDGQLTREELRPKPPQRPGNGQGNGFQRGPRRGPGNGGGPQQGGGQGPGQAQNAF